MDVVVGSNVYRSPPKESLDVPSSTLILSSVPFDVACSSLPLPAVATTSRRGMDLVVRTPASENSIFATFVETDVIVPSHSLLLYIGMSLLSLHSFQ